MECISVFDMLKIGVGPSSSHTLGPWRAAERWIAELEEQHVFENVRSIKAYLYGSLCLTGKGHATDIAVVMGLLGTDPETVDIDSISGSIDRIKTDNTLLFGGKREIPFNFLDDIL
ncbi:MAG: serine dehydratase beta chain, partial [Bacteroidota bacterium]|nr:serine dehydratase beta chain [Bacteroidota bacterium]